MSNKFINVANKGYTQLSQFMDSGLWNQPFVFEIPYSSPLAPDQNNTVGVAERGMLHAFSNSGKYFYCVDSSKGWQESPYALKSDLSNVQKNTTQLGNALGAIKYVYIESVTGNSIMEVVKNSYSIGKIPYNSTIIGMISYQGIWGINGYTYPEGQSYCSFILHKYDDDEIVHVRNMNGDWKIMSFRSS